MTNYKKKYSCLSISKAAIISAITILIIFINSINFIMHNKSADIVILPRYDKDTGNELPPKPVERWRYIKELENCQTSIQYPIELTTSSKVHSLDQLTNEQYQLLTQIQADMHQKPIHLNKSHYDNQNKTATVIQTNQIPQIQHNIFHQKSAQMTHYTAPTTFVTIPIQPTQKNVKTDMVKKGPQHWLLQCSSFKAIDQAESIRAQLALAGIESRITTSSGLNRIMLGPYASRSGADKILQRVHDVGVSNCIHIAPRG